MVGIAFLLLLSVQFVSGSNCAPGWLEFKDRCYVFVKQYLTWEASRAECAIFKSQLAEVNNTELNDWLLAQIKKQSIGSIWIGGSSLYTHNGEWEWVPRGRFFGTYQNWDPTKPNNPDPMKCVLLNSFRYNKWTSEDCRDYNSYICMKPRVGTKCEFGFREFKGKCFTFGTEDVKWAHAVGRCRQMDADIAEINSAELNAWLGEQVKAIPSVGNSWIGGSTLSSDGSWEWMRSKQPISSFVNWWRTEPNYLATEKCVQLSTAINGQWYNAPCSWGSPFVCEKRQVYDYFYY